MILRIFSMYDEKAEAFIRPFFMPNLALARRAIVKTGEDPDHAFAHHPNDYILYELGTWEEEHAEFNLTVTPIRHGSVYELTPERTRDQDQTKEAKHG